MNNDPAAQRKGFCGKDLSGHRKPLASGKKGGRETGLKEMKKAVSVSVETLTAFKVKPPVDCDGGVDARRTRIGLC